MRNSVLGILGEVIMRVLSGEELDSKQKSTRDQFLDKLEVYMQTENTKHNHSSSYLLELFFSGSVKTFCFFRSMKR